MYRRLSRTSMDWFSRSLYRRTDIRVKPLRARGDTSDYRLCRRLFRRKQEKSRPFLVYIRSRSFNNLHPSRRCCFSHGSISRLHGQVALYQSCSHSRNDGLPAHGDCFNTHAFPENERSQDKGTLRSVPARHADRYCLLPLCNSGSGCYPSVVSQ